MQYLGGKFRIAKQLTSYLESIRQDRVFLEPFVGAAHICMHMKGTRIASDYSEDLVLLWQALQDGWVPPLKVSEEEYQSLKSATPSALRGFAGYGLSFSGKWFGGYARNSRGDDYCANARNSLLKIASKIANVTFLHCSYDVYDTSIENHLIYCDPPYANTTKYRFDFDHSKFWTWVRKMSVRNTVVVSEYTAPSDFEEVWSIQTKTDLRGVNQNRVERLFQLA